MDLQKKKHVIAAWARDTPGVFKMTGRRMGTSAKPYYIGPNQIYEMSLEPTCLSN